MTKKDIVALADLIKIRPYLFKKQHIDAIANFLATQNEKFDRNKFLSYIADNDVNANVKKLAVAFSNRLIYELTPQQLDEVRFRNTAEQDSSICHSHDFCDSNMAMNHAWGVVFKRHVDLRSQSDIEIWNEAWALAKENDFYFPK